jgi:hypothetical protein
MAGRLGVPHSWSGLFEEDKNLLHLLEIKLLGCMSKTLVPVMIQKSWFLLEMGENEREFALLTASSLSVVYHHTLPPCMLIISTVCVSLYTYIYHSPQV